RKWRSAALKFPLAKYFLPRAMSCLAPSPSGGFATARGCGSTDDVTLPVVAGSFDMGAASSVAAPLARSPRLAEVPQPASQKRQASATRCRPTLAVIAASYRRIKPSLAPREAKTRDARREWQAGELTLVNDG